VYEALEAKTGGAIRGNISNAANVSQSLLLSAYSDGAYATEKQAKYELLRSRYERVKQILAEHSEYAGEFEALPFNSGYFMCVRLRSADPEQVRQKLLTDYSTGVIAMSGIVRLAFSAVPLEQLPVLFENLFRAVRDLKKQG
jgi:aspartate/methionine/tyrosine aminotransferase